MSETDKKKLIAEIEKTLDEIRPHLQVDGGDIAVVDITDDMVVQVKLLGNCINCSMSSMTMKAGVEQAIKAQFPKVQHVEAVNLIPG